MFWVLLVRVSILLGRMLAGCWRFEPASSYNAIVGRKIMLLIKCDILIPKEHYAPLRLLAKLSIRTIEKVIALRTSATNNANSSF
jgi:hypothetical protein